MANTPHSADSPTQERGDTHLKAAGVAGYAFVAVSVAVLLASLGWIGSLVAAMSSGAVEPRLVVVMGGAPAVLLAASGACTWVGVQALRRPAAS